MKNSAVNTIIFSEDEKKILIILRRDVPVWVIPGGMIEPDEKPEDAAVREAFEETGCRISICRKSGVYHPVNSLTAVTHVFVCKKLEGVPQTGSETKDIGFFPIDALPKNFFHLHKELIEDAINHPETILEKKLTQVNYITLFKYFLRHPIRVIRVILSRMGFPLNT